MGIIWQLYGEPLRKISVLSQYAKERLSRARAKLACSPKVSQECRAKFACALLRRWCSSFRLSLHASKDTMCL